MTKITTSRQFINEVMRLNPSLPAKPSFQNEIVWGERVKFNDKTNIRSLDDLKKILAPLGITEFENIENSGKTTYKNRGFKVVWNGSPIKILLNSSNQEEGFYPRKTFSPEKFGLAGYNSVTSNESFIEVFERGVDQHPSIVEEHKIIIIDLVKSVLEDREFNVYTWLIESGELSSIESDLGEVLACAYSIRLRKSISVPDTSNAKLKDFEEDGIPVSVKSPKGGSVTLTGFPIRPNKTPVEQVLNVCGLEFNEAKITLGHKNKTETARYRKETIYGSAAKMPGIITDLSKLTNGTTINDVEKFINKTSYSNFIQWVKTHPENPNGLGVPDMEEISKDLWTRGNTEPFYFTLCTLIFNGPWAKRNQQEISSVLKLILTGPKFYDVKIDLNKRRVIIKEQFFDDVENWTTHYWSRCHAAFHNLPGAKRMKETK